MALYGSSALPTYAADTFPELACVNTTVHLASYTVAPPGPTPFSVGKTFRSLLPEHAVGIAVPVLDAKINRTGADSNRTDVPTAARCTSMMYSLERVCCSALKKEPEGHSRS